jgi:hypothetical protein
VKKLFLFEGDLIVDIKKHAGKLQHVTLPPALAVEIVVDLDDELYGLLDGDQRFIEEVAKANSAFYTNGCVKTVVAFIKAADARMAQAKDQAAIDRIADEIQTRVGSALQDTYKKVIGEFEKARDSVLKIKKIAKKFKTTQRLKVGAGVAGIAGSTVGVIISAGATPLTGGASAAGIVLGAVGIAKSVKSTVDDVKTLTRSCDDTEEDVRKMLRKLQASYQAAGKAKVSASELGAKAADTFFAVEINSITNLKQSFRDFVGKFAAVRLKEAPLGALIGKLVIEQEKAEKQLEDWNAGLKAAVNQASGEWRVTVEKQEDHVRQLAIRYKKLILKTDAVVKGAATLGERVSRKMEQIQSWKQAIADLEAKKPTWVGWAEKGMVVLNLVPAAATCSGVEELVGLGIDISTEVAAAAAEQKKLSTKKV